MAAKYLECSPKRRLHFEKLSGKTGDEKCLKTVLDHHFNFSVSIGYPFILFGSTERTQDEIMFFSSQVGLLVPTFSKHKLLQNISSQPLSKEFCCLTDMPLTEFIDTTFIQKFVEKGTELLSRVFIMWGGGGGGVGLG